MPKFIKVTTANNEPMMLNIDHIVSVFTSGPYTYIWHGVENGTTQFTESLEEIMEMINGQ